MTRIRGAAMASDEESRALDDAAAALMKLAFEGASLSIPAKALARMSRPEICGSALAATVQALAETADAKSLPTPGSMAYVIGAGFGVALPPGDHNAVDLAAAFARGILAGVARRGG